MSMYNQIAMTVDVIDQEHQMQVDVIDQEIQMTVDVAITSSGSQDEYKGEYEVTPMQDTQILRTGGLLMTGNVVINPIPSNYGLITWNGAELTVS